MERPDDSALSIDEPWVSVADEPSHHELFWNDYVRVYMASIEPGARTLPHRHDENTLYVVVSGGASSTIPAPGSESVPYRFPRSISTIRKLRWLARRTLLGSVYLPVGACLYMANRDRPVIHSVRASRRNRGTMLLMGIEILRPVAVHLPTDVWRPTPDIVLDGAVVYRYSGEQQLRAILGRPGMRALVVGTAPSVVGRFIWYDDSRRNTPLSDVVASGAAIVFVER
jgi:hypothetical protein